MRVSFLYKGVLVAATLCVAPAALPASPNGGQPDPRAVAVNTGASPNATSALLEQIRSDATSVENGADQLRELLRETSTANWEGDAFLLVHISDRVNEMNKHLFYLREHEAEASSLQQKIIEGVEAPAIELADTTQDAANTLKNNEAAVYMSDLASLAKDIYDEAGRVDRTVGDLSK